MGSVQGHDMGSMILLNTTLTGDRYVNILSGQLHPFMTCVHSDVIGHFQLDNGTIHWSRGATQ